ncbi:MAG: hypothetical protein AAF550_04195 [Myxococcota bacterium]
MLEYAVSANSSDLPSRYLILMVPAEEPAATILRFGDHVTAEVATPFPSKYKAAEQYGGISPLPMI